MELQARILATEPHGILDLPSGEFFCSVTIGRPITVVGQGKATWIGSRVSPAIRITAPGVELRDLMVEHTSWEKGVALEAEPGTNPILRRVYLVGGLTGVPPENIRDTDEEPISITFLPPPPMSAATGEISSLSPVPAAVPLPVRDASGRPPLWSTDMAASMPGDAAPDFTTWHRSEKPFSSTGWSLVVLASILLFGAILVQLVGESARKGNTQSVEQTLQQLRTEMRGVQESRDNALAKVKKLEREIQQKIARASGLEQERDKLLVKVKELEGQIRGPSGFTVSQSAAPGGSPGPRPRKDQDEEQVKRAADLSEIGMLAQRGNAAAVDSLKLAARQGHEDSQRILRKLGVGW